MPPIPAVGIKNIESKHLLIGQVKKLKKQLWQSKHIAAFSSLGPEALNYLEALVEANQPVKKNVSRLLSIKDEYGAGRRDDD